MVPLNTLSNIIQNDALLSISLCYPNNKEYSYIGRVLLDECTDEITVLYDNESTVVFKNSNIEDIKIISKNIIDEYESAIKEVDKNTGDKNSIFHKHLLKVCEHLPEDATRDY